MNLSSLQTCSVNSPKITPEVHIFVDHDLPVTSLSAHIKSWSFNLVIVIGHTLTLIHSRNLSLILNVLVKEWWTSNACIDLCPMPMEGIITWLWYFPLLNSSISTFLSTCSRQQIAMDQSRHTILNISVVLVVFSPPPLFSNPHG